MERESYNDMYIHEDVHWWFTARRSILQKVLSQHCRYNNPQNILEVGCGSGGNLQMLKAYGDLFAMELDDNTREIANRKNICNVKKGVLPNDIPFDESFDLICIFDVLEHINDDLETLKSLRKKLNRKGTLIITVPAYMFLWSAHDEANHHKRRYTKKQLIDIVSESGLSVIYTSYFNTILFPIIATVRIINNIINKKAGSDINLPPKAVNNLLKRIFSIEKALLPKISFPFGVSIILIAKNE